MNRTHKALAVAALTGSIGLAIAGQAAAAGYDPTFGFGGVSIRSSSGDSDRYQGGLALGPDDSSYESGYSTLNTSAVPTNRATLVSKTDKNGELDPSFSGDGIFTIDLGRPAVAGGQFNAAPAGATTPNDGRLEQSRGLNVQADGKIVVASQAETTQDLVPDPLATPDYRDRDIYVFRLNTNGTLDTTFNAAGARPGVLQLDLSDGIRPVPNGTLNSDATYGVRIQPDGKIIVETTKGTQTGDPRAFRPWAILRILANGTLDPTWNAAGTGGNVGVALSPVAAVDVNERQPLIQPDGKIVAAGYGNKVGGGGSTPYLARFNTDGTLDTAFGGAGTGMTTQAEGEKVAFTAECYDTAFVNGNIVMVGYGNRNNPAGAAVDALIYRFTSDGKFDTTWATSNGLTTFDRAGGQDRFRELTTLPDGRFVATGLSSSTALTPGPEKVDGLMAVVKADGTFDTSIGAGGTFPIDLGGDSDGLLGSATLASGTKVVAAGFRGFAAPNGANDEPAVVRLDVSPNPAPPVAPAPVIIGIPVPVPTSPAVVAKAAKVTVTCKRVGKKRKSITCTTKGSSKTVKGTVRITLRRNGKTVATGKASIKKGTAAVKIKGTAKAGRYSITATLPTSTSKRQTVKKTLTIR